MSCNKLKWNTITASEAVTQFDWFSWLDESRNRTLHHCTTSLIAALLLWSARTYSCVNPLYKILGSHRHRGQFEANFVLICVCSPFPPYYNPTRGTLRMLLSCHKRANRLLISKSALFETLGLSVRLLILDLTSSLENRELYTFF